jgi:6-phosphogluconolactonase
MNMAIPKICKPLSAQNFNTFAADFLFNRFCELERNKKQNINVALSGGSTPLPILQLLKDYPLQWERYNFFLVDERCVPVTSSDSNLGNISKIFFDFISSTKFSMIRENYSSEESVQLYREQILQYVDVDKQGFSQFDLILLGMGDDGHTASLFPSTNALKIEHESIVLNVVPQLNTERITMTYPIILNAKEVILLFKGENKQKILQEIISGSNNAYPISRIINDHPCLTCLIG